MNKNEITQFNEKFGTTCESFEDILNYVESLKSQKKVKTVSKKYVRTDKELAVNQSLPKQAKILLASITSEPITLETWTENALANHLETNQEPIRITMYYRPRLVEAGLVKLAE
jgi:hypothetical protein